SDPVAKEEFETAVAKKSEAEGIRVFHRTEGGRRLSFLDTRDFPERIQGYGRIASIADHALYLYPSTGSLTAADGELAVLASVFSLSGTMLLPGGTSPAVASSSLKGTMVSAYPVQFREKGSSLFDATKIMPRSDFGLGTLVYVDRVFSVKGVGTVALGFVLSGTVKVHDSLRGIPGTEGKSAEVKGIQVNDVDYESAGRGIRVGLSLRGVEPKDLDRSHWLDDGTFMTSDTLILELAKAPFYKGDIAERELHLQLPGEMVPAMFSTASGTFSASLPYPVPVWEGMRACVVDLNGKGLRVAAGATCKL
ncbi:MAG TPA: EF-Tu/IF-2/RF-3 family GTPase, partial [Nitrososphaerales archaeon]|nr:EF-Tu/IF-2/RF-3 family GTPase [Nitrososphaerales archaeon]